MQQLVQLEMSAKFAVQFVFRSPLIKKPPILKATPK